MASLRVERLGCGPPVFLVHGAVAGGAQTWSEQRPLAERWTLHVVDRPGYGDAAPIEREDFEVDAALVADALPESVHLVGHSYGGVVSLLAAARRPEAVRSLAVVEPPCFGVARGDPDVDGFVATMVEHWAHGPGDPAGFLRGFLALVGSDLRISEPLPPSLERGARILQVERGPWEAEIPLDALAAAPFPRLVFSGGHHPAFDAVCDVLEQRLVAERDVLRGHGHSVQRAGRAFNDRLERFWLQAG